MRIETVKEPIFKQRFLLYSDCEFADFYKEVTGDKFDDDSSVFCGHCINTPNAEICIWVKDRNDMPTLVHELLHATQFALFSRCWVNNKESETPAYYLEFLLKSFTESNKQNEHPHNNRIA